MKRVFVFLTVLAIAAMLLVGCAQSEAPSLTPDQTTPGPTTQPSGPGIGTIQVRVTDALPEYIIEAVNVSFSKVEVHRAADESDGDGGWITLNITGGTFGNDGSFDLKELGDAGKVELLAEDGVLAGWYNQIRVTVSHVDVTYTELENQDDGEPESITVQAKLPSDKLKFVRPFRVIDGGTTTIDLDFDLYKSVVFTGSKKDVNVIVKPVVKLSVSEKGKPTKLEATLKSTDEADAELSTEIKRTGKDSAHLKTPAFTRPEADEARIVIPLPGDTTLGKIESISWWTYLVDGYIPHVDLVLDYDGDTSRDDVLVAEAAHQNDDDATTWKDSYKGENVGWIETFKGASGDYTSWAMSGTCSDVTSVNDETAVWMVAANDPDFGLDTLASFQTATGKTDGSITVNEETAVLALEIEIDNWIYQSEAYVDDIEVIIDGVTYKVHL